jgi:hypothetical protein
VKTANVPNRLGAKKVNFCVCDCTQPNKWNKFSLKIGQNYHYYTNMAAIYTHYLVGKQFLPLINRKQFED